MGANVPKQYQDYVKGAAAELGIPQSIVAEQINLESGFNPNAKSSAGAEGIAQFEPGTFKSYGTGSPFNPADAFAAYIKYMKSLLKQEGGSVYKALEAYNAGPGNLKAGSGYAATILSRAGEPDSTEAGKGLPTPINAGSTPTVDNPSSGGLINWPGDIVGFFKGGVTTLQDIMKIFVAFFNPATYIRIGIGVFALIALILAIYLLYKESQ